MKTKEELLTELQEALRFGVVSQYDLQTLSARPTVPKSPTKPDKLTAVDVMFFVAGVVLFATIMSIIVQSWHDGRSFKLILLSAVLGMVLWSVAYYLVKNSRQSDGRRGLINALLLTGILLVIVGGYIITNRIVGGLGLDNYVAISAALAVLGVVHIGFDWLIKRDLILLMGILLAVAALPVLLIGLLRHSSALLDVRTIIMVITAGVLAYVTRLIGIISPARKKLDSSFDSLAAFVGLLSMYGASYGDHAVVWLVFLVVAVTLMFFLSVGLQNKNLLGNASFFMVLTVVTIALKYFSGYGVTFSLTIATLGLLGSAAIATTINKRYFGRPAQSGGAAISETRLY